MCVGGVGVGDTLWIFWAVAAAVERVRPRQHTTLALTLALAHTHTHENFAAFLLREKKVNGKS